MLRSVGYKCPSCGRRLAPVSGMQSATQIVERTCGGCRETWRIRITPVAVTGGMADVGDFTFVGRKLRSGAAQ